AGGGGPIPQPAPGPGPGETPTATPSATASPTPTAAPTSPATPAPTPDPAPVETELPTDFADSIEFIYSGPGKVQTGVEPGTIKSARVAVLRGRVPRPAAQGRGAGAV